MQILRLSTVETFGAPVDHPEMVSTTGKVVELMRQYSAKEEEVSSDLVDITPYYYDKDITRYFLSRRGTDGAAVIEMMQPTDDATAVLIANAQDGSRFAAELGSSTIVVPENVPAFAVAGPGPRFAGQICIHELIFDKDAI